jgi:hypothetical protein
MAGRITWVGVLGNDEGQAGDDLSLAKKLVAVNPVLLEELEPYAELSSRSN